VRTHCDGCSAARRCNPARYRFRFVRLATGLLIAALCLLAAMAPSALAGPVEDFRDDGALNVCDYSPQELEDAGASLPPDVIQYSPGLADQLNGGREGCGGGTTKGADPRENVSDPADTDQDGDVDSADAAAAAGGGKGGKDGAASRVPDAPTPSTAARARLADIATPSVSTATGSDVPAWVVTLLIGLGLGALLFTLVRFGGYSTERFTNPLGASFSEAGGRTADAMAEVWDSVRLGR